MVIERGIEADSNKIRAILDMPAPMTEIEIKGFLGRLQYISRFIARLIRHLEYLLSSPVLVPPTLGRPLLLYLLVSDVALGRMLAQLDDSGKERAIYYLSKRMLDYKTRYVMIEHYCLALVWATRRLRHYMTEYSMHLISRLDPLRYLFDKPALVRRLMRWLVLLTEAIDDDFPDEDVATVTSLSGWRMYFDGAANHFRYGIGVLLISPHGDHIPRSVHLAFSDRHPATNNIIQGEWKTRDVKLRPYHAYLELLVGRFDDLRYTHLPKAQNQFVDALATLASMIDILVDVVVHLLLIESRSGIDIIGKISPQSSSGHEFILVTIDYFTKWVEAASYARLTSSGVTSFIISHIICHYRVPHELISNKGVHFRADVDTLLQRYGIQHHRSSVYRPQTNGAVEAANKNIKRILRRMIPEVDWAQARLNQLNLLDERRLRATNHVCAYQRKMACAFKKQVKPRLLQRSDLVLKVTRGLIRDPRRKFRPNWSEPYFIRELTLEGVVWLMDLDGN
ncbi:Retrovirus-related Pol polyprotein from transposon 297 [Vitis vinifera]|uniref:Retrovirus-related Pol polyprotein from transposon 297 n=1 Tax=Vitis vinifera TaxID=29760 RepID=A0A438DNI0_VITVI|nr:Retrovirus-related Pol polyprotein from transposon 297 [Vitis vinifera]